MPSEIKLSPISEVEEMLFLLYRNEIPVTIPDTAIVRDGALRGLFYCPNAHVDCHIEYDADWPMVDYDSHQTRMYSTKRASEAAAKIEVAGNFFAKESTTFDAPIVIHLSVAAPKQTQQTVDVCCQFLTKSRFLELLRANQLANGLICRYVTPINRHHNMVRVVFTPFAIQVEQHESTATIDDSSMSMAERVSISPGNGGSFAVVQPSEETKSHSSTFTSRLFEFFRSQGTVMDRGIFFFIQTHQNRLTFMWAGDIVLKPWYLENEFTLTDASRASQTKPNSLSSSATPLLSVSRSSAQPPKESARQHPTGNRRPLCPSPVPVPLQLENTAQLLADVKDFGFYSGETEKIRDSLKRQIRSVAKVQLPLSMQLDDTPPYTDEFIAALIDPVKADAYFFPTLSGMGKHRKSTALLRSKSKIFRFFETDESRVDERTSKLDRSMGSFRRVRSGSVTSWTPTSATPPQVEGNRASLAFLDPEVSAILVKNSDSEAAHVEALDAGISHANREVAAMLAKAKPDWKHSGHMALIRRKYGKQNFQADEDEAECRRLASFKLVTNKAEKQVERRLSVTSGASSASHSKARASSLKNTSLRSEREQGWVGASHVDHNRTAPFQRLSRTPPSCTEHLIKQPIPKYESKLAEGSLLGYLVDTQQFENITEEAVLDVPLEDCRSTSKDRPSIGLATAPLAPDPPVVELTNLHLSLSEELITQRREACWEQHRPRHNSSMLEALFGPYNASLKSLKSMVGVGVPRESSGLRSSHHPISQRSVAREDDDDSSNFSQAQQAFNDQILRSQQNDEKMQRQANFHRHGISDSKEQVQLIVGTLEDLVYQWASDPANDPKHFGKKHQNDAQKMVLHVPPAYFHLRRELRSLFVNLGFEEQSVEATSISAYQQAITDDFLEEVPQFVKLFSVDVTPVTVSRVIAAAKLFASDVATLYADEKWEIIEKIREMTETQGFTFVDAVLMVASGNLMERSSVSALSYSFVNIKV